MQKYSAQEIFKLQEKMQLRSLPTTREGIAFRAKSEEWPYEEVKGKGGRKGIKRIYSLPKYVLTEIESKGLHVLIGLTPSKLKEACLAYEIETPQTQQVNINDDNWHQQIDFSCFIPIRCFTNTYLTIENGSVTSKEQPYKVLLFDHEFIYYQLGVDPIHIICLPIDGNSMSPTLKAGGIAMIDLSKGYSGEGIYLIQQGEELKLKRLQKITADNMLIISDNRSVYSSTEINLSKTPPEQFNVLGKYLWDAGTAK